MNEREAKRAMKRLCSAAMAGGRFYPEMCQRCQSPCKYGTQVLRHLGIMRTAPKDTPSERNMSERRIRTLVRGYNAKSIIR